jgi:uncharacterized sulfatase
MKPKTSAKEKTRIIADSTSQKLKITSFKLLNTKPKIFIPYPFFHFFSIFLTIVFLIHTEIVRSQTTPSYNVLFIAVDDMNDRIGFLGNSEVVAPNLKRLVARGMVFKLAYCQYPLCNASRTSILSGWRPDKTQIFGNSIRPSSVMGSNVVYLPEYFKKFGYRIERYGKIMHGSFENDITWDYAEPPESSDNGIMLPSERVNSNVLTSTIISNSTAYPGGDWWIKDIADTRLPDGTEARNLVTRMQQAQSKPFFYALGLHAHNPFTPSLKYWNMNGDPSVQELLPVDRYGTLTDLKGNGSATIRLPSTPQNDRSDVPSIAFPSAPIVKPNDEWRKTIHAYDAEVAQMDAQLGLVLDEMDRQNLWKNTVVVFWSDHGQHLGEHEGTWLKNTLFEESLHVPLIVCAPGKPAGQCSRLVELVDLYPTLAELCGLPAPGGMEGSSFARLLDNPKLTWKRAAFSQVKGSNKIMGRSIRTERYRYTSWGTEGEELYDHSADPHEYNNLAGNSQYATTLNQMRTILAQGWKSSVPPATSITSNLAGVTIGSTKLTAPSDKLSLSPNPSAGNLTVTYDSYDAGKTQLKIYDMNGRILFDKTELMIKGMNKFNLNLIHFLSGVYFFEVNNAGVQTRKKFMIIK